MTLNFSLGKPAVTAELKVTPDDFQVRERLGFELSGQGEHQCLWIHKVGENTAWVGEQLAKYAGVRSFDVSYCGRKDRHANTSQWFSVWLPGKQVDWSQFALPGVTIEEVRHHDRKLRKGSHWGNEFVISLRHLRGDLASLEARLELVRQSGFPNYFGEQRFGRQGENLVMADKLVAGGRVPRDKRDIYLSAMRSYMFNCTLSDQIAIEPPGPTDRGWLFGGARKQTPALEAIHQKWPQWCDMLIGIKMKAQLRDSIAMPENFQWEIVGDSLTLCFALQGGAYATSLIRELVDYGGA